MGYASFDDILTFLKHSQIDDQQHLLGIITPDGKLTDINGVEIDLSQFPNTKEAFNSEETKFFCDSYNDFTFLVCTTPIRIDGENKFVIFSTYLTSRYADSISTPTFENKGYSYVIDSDGKRIVGSSHNGSFGLTFDNLFDEMSQASSKNDSAIQQMQADLKEGKSDGIIMLNGIEKYIYYTPLNINDWYILTVVPKNVVTKFMIVCTILLVCVLIPGLGVKLNGSRRWLNTPFLQLQPSEFMKPVIAMYFARLVDSGKYNLKHLKGNLPYIGVMLIVVGLMLMETHLSGAIVIAGIGVSVMIAGGTPIKPVLIGALILLPIGLIGVRALSGVRWARVTSFMNPFADIRDESYQVVQGLYAIGSGGIFGLGLGQSVQKYSYLPEPYNDFIFAIVCEELGLIGAAVVILLFAALIIRAIRIAMNAPDTYGSLVAVGIAAQLAIQTILNIAVATSSVPNTGVALPFFSYGGTAIITLLCEMGVLLNISRHSVKD